MFLGHTTSPNQHHKPFMSVINACVHCSRTLSDKKKYNIGVRCSVGEISMLKCDYNILNNLQFFLHEVDLSCNCCMAYAFVFSLLHDNYIFTGNSFLVFTSIFDYPVTPEMLSNILILKISRNMRTCIIINL